MWLGPAVIYSKVVDEWRYWAERGRSKFPLTAHASFCNSRSATRLPLHRIFSRPAPAPLIQFSDPLRSRSAQGRRVYGWPHHGPQKTSWPHTVPRKIYVKGKMDYFALELGRYQYLESVFGIFVGIFSCRFGILYRYRYFWNTGWKSQIFGMPHLYLAPLFRAQCRYIQWNDSQSRNCCLGPPGDEKVW